jgi:outer membrane protein TolC
MNKIVIFCVTLLFSVTLAAQDTLKLSLEQCHNLALEHSKKIKIADQNINKAQGEKIAARSALFPNISASATGMYSRNTIQTELMLPTKTFDIS